MTNRATTADDFFVPEPKQTKKEAVTVRLAQLALALTLIVPIVIVPGVFFPYVTTRNVFFRLAVELAVAILLLGGTERFSAVGKSKDSILKWFGIYIAAISVSAVAGAAPWRSMFGDFERMGGVWAWLHLLLFYVLLRIVMTDGSWRLFFRGALVVADLVALWGMGTLLPGSFRNPNFVMGLTVGSTIGNAGLLAPYLLFALGIAVHLLVTDRGRARGFFYAVSGALAGVAMILTVNRSTVLGAVAGVMAGLVLYFCYGESRTRSRSIAVTTLVVVIAAIVGGVYVSRLPAMSGSRLRDKWALSLNTQTNELRTLEWAAAGKGFLDHPLLGYGPENTQVASAAHFSPQLFDSPDGVGIFDRVHNVWLELLTTTGLAGTIAMLGIWVAFGRSLRTSVRSGSLAPSDAAVWGGLAIAYAVYLTLWFFDLNSSMLWVMMLAFVANKLHGPLELSPQSKAPPRKLLLVPLEILLVLAAYVHGIVPMKAAYDLDTALQSPDIEARLSAFYRAMDSAAPQTFHTTELYTRAMTQLLPIFPEARTNPFRYAEIDLALKRGFIEARHNIQRNPQDDRPYVDQARLSLLGLAFYGDNAYARGAIKTLKYALRISPFRSDNRVLLANTYLSVHDTTNAVMELNKAEAYAPQFGPTYYALAKIANARGDAESARVLLLRCLERRYAGASPLYWKVMSRLEAQHRDLEAAQLAEKLLATKFRKLAEWGSGKPAYAPPLSPVDKVIASNLPVAYLRAGKRADAIRAARAVGAGWPEASGAARTFQDPGYAANFLAPSSSNFMFPVEQ